MICLYENLANYSNKSYLNNLSSLPAWRKEKVLQYKWLDDRKCSVLAFVLLQHALQAEYNISEVPEFVYNEFGKPSFMNYPIHFSLSHCNNAVACAVSDYEIGIDVEKIVPYNLEVAQRVCNKDELNAMENSHTKDSDFIKLWTMKEAISKYEGLGLSLNFSQIQSQDYYIYNYDALDNCIMSVCYGKKKKHSRCYQIPTIKLCHF